MSSPTSTTPPANRVDTSLPSFFHPTHPASPSSLPASQTALLLCDYHNILLSSVPSGPLCAANAAKFRDFALANGVSVVHCLIDLERVPATFKSPHGFVAFRAMAGKNPKVVEEAEVVAPVSVNADEDAGGKEVVAMRPAGCLSALFTDGLRDLFAAKDIKSVIVAGLLTSGVVMRTACQAADEGFVVTVLEDACADRAEGVHEMVLGASTGGMVGLAVQAHVVGAETAIEELGRVWS